MERLEFVAPFSVGIDFRSVCVLQSLDFAGTVLGIGLPCLVENRGIGG